MEQGPNHYNLDDRFSLEMEKDLLYVIIGKVGMKMDIRL